MAQCTATAKRTGKQCRAAAIKGRDKCRVHGGMTPIKHGLFSKYPEAVAGEHLKAAQETELRETLKQTAGLLAAVLSRWTEQGFVFDPLFYKAVSALSGRLTAAIKAHEEIRRHEPGQDDYSDVDRWLEAFSGTVTQEVVEKIWEEPLKDGR